MRVAILASLLGLTACSSVTPADPASGGATTTLDSTSGAYADPATNLGDDALDSFNLGHSLFDQTWVTAPATTSDQDGLGPIFNQRSCSACHSHDGRAAPFDEQGNLLGLLFRLSVPGADAHGGPLGDTVYATQLRPYGILTVPGDGTPSIAYTEKSGAYGDGTTYSLQAPANTVTAWAYGQPATSMMYSSRTGPALIGLGLLEAIPEATILANIKTNDPDGVVGKANYVWNVTTNAAELGRFGWKANQPSVSQQTGAALNSDIGITSASFPNEPCTATMTACLAAPRGGQPDITDDSFLALVRYMETLAVPARRDLTDSHALHGEKLFAEMGCASCHVPTMQTGAFPDVPAVENQTIHPYTDLLLHDMGPDLADGRTDYLASGTEWRTPPLWGIGLLMTVNGHDHLLHDARARGLEEAILWHGGEAEVARERFRTAKADDRNDLVTFLDSL